LAKNQSNIQVDGIELDYLLDKKINLTNSIKIKSGFILIHTENKNGPLSFYLSSAPKFLANFTTTFSTKQIDFNLTGLYKSRNGQTANPILLPVSNDYFVVNSKIYFRFTKVKHIVFVQADNLFNSTINDFIGSPLPGRWLQVGARFIFN